MELDFDFDYLCELNKNDPEEFEAYRQKLIDTALQNASEASQRRLRGLQFQVDAKRQIHSNAPFVSCIEISKMMHQSFNEMRLRLNQAASLSDAPQLPAGENQTCRSHENTVVSLKFSAD